MDRKSDHGSLTFWSERINSGKRLFDETKGCLNLYQGITRPGPQDNWREHRPVSSHGREASRARRNCLLRASDQRKLWMRNARSTIFLQPKTEMAMRKKVLTVFVAPLMTALTLQAAAASEHHHTRTKARVVASERSRNSNALYAAPGDYSVPSYWSNRDEGAMSGAGH
jgi:hypothetical protein